MGFHRGPNITTDGIKSLWDFKNAKSYPVVTGSINDISGNGNHSENFEQFNSGSFNSDGFYTFNGIDQQVNVPSIPSNNMTCEVWFNPSVLDASARGLYGDGAYFRIYLVNNTLIMWGREEAGGTTANTTYSIPDEPNQWYHAAGTLESGVGIQLFFNGELVNTESHTVTYFDGGDNACFGNYYDGASAWFSGSIATVRHYNKVLSEEEIKNNFNAVKGRFGIK